MCHTSHLHHSGLLKLPVHASTIKRGQHCVSSFPLDRVSNAGSPGHLDYVQGVLSGFGMEC